MATIINTPPQQPREDGSASGIIVGVILAILLITLFVIYGLPAIRQNPAPQQQPDTTNIIVTPPACTNDTWSCTGWSACYLGRTTRTCTMTYDCPGVATPSPDTEGSCAL